MTGASIRCKESLHEHRTGPEWADLTIGAPAAPRVRRHRRRGDTCYDGPAANGSTMSEPRSRAHPSGIDAMKNRPALRRMCWFVLSALTMAAAGLFARRCSTFIWRRCIGEDPPTQDD